MQAILTRLKNAQRLMPKAMPRATSGAMILTLLVWKWLSDAWQQQASTTGPTGPKAPPAASGHAAMPQFSPDCLFGACRSPFPLRFGNAIRTSLYSWMALQPDQALDDIVLPERFGDQSEFAAQLGATPALANLMAVIGDITYQPELALGPLVERAMLHLGLLQHSLPPRLAQLAAQLVQVFPHETILDPLCRRGDLLIACVSQLAQASQSALHPAAPSPQLFGQHTDPAKLALAKLRLLAHGYPPGTLHRSHFLNAPLVKSPIGALQRADIVLSYIAAPAPPAGTAASKPAATPNTSAPAQLAAAPGTIGTPGTPGTIGIFPHRFPMGAPETPELAQIWHALACVKPHNARLGLIVPAQVLATPAAQPLMQYLLRHWLAAVIDLPPLLWPENQHDMLLLICSKQAYRRQVSFICPNQPIRAADPDDCTYPPDYEAHIILQAWYAINSRQSHPNLRQIPHSRIAGRQYSLNWRDYRRASNKIKPCHTNMDTCNNTPQAEGNPT